jgi:hypothetical protein
MLNRADDSFFATFGPEALAYGDNYYVESARLGRDAGTLIHTGDANAYNTDGNGTPKGSAVGIMTATDGGGPYDVPGYTFEYDVSFPDGEYGIQMYSGNTGVTPMTVYILDADDNVLHTVQSDGSGFDLAYYSVQIGAVAATHPITELDSTSESPSGDVGFEKGDKPAFYLYSPQAYDVWFMVEGSWAQFQAASHTGGMSFKWPAGSTRCYVEKSVSDQHIHMFERDLTLGYLCDSDDADSEADSFHFTGSDFTVSEMSGSVSGQTPMQFAATGDIVHVLEGGVIQFNYAWDHHEGGVLITPPAGKDGVQIQVRFYTKQ